MASVDISASLDITFGIDLHGVVFCKGRLRGSLDLPAS